MQVNLKNPTYSSQIYKTKNIRSTCSPVSRDYSNNTCVQTYNYNPIYFQRRLLIKSDHNKMAAYITNVKNAFPGLIPDNADINDIKKIIEENAPEIHETIEEFCESGDAKKLNLNKEQIKFILENKLGFYGHMFTGYFQSLSDIEKAPLINMEHSTFMKLHKELNKLFCEEMINKRTVRQRVATLQGLFDRRNFDGITTKVELFEKIKSRTNKEVPIETVLKNTLEENFIFSKKSRIQKQIVEYMFGLKNGNIYSDNKIANKLGLSIENFNNLKTDVLFKIRLLIRTKKKKDVNNLIAIPSACKLYKTNIIRISELERAFPQHIFDGIFIKDRLLIKMDEEILSGKSIKNLIKDTLEDKNFKKDPEYKLKKQIIELKYGLIDGNIYLDYQIAHKLFKDVDMLEPIQKQAVDQLINILKQNKSIKFLNMPQIVDETSPVKSDKVTRTLNLQTILRKKLYLGIVLEKSNKILTIFKNIKNEEDFNNAMNEKFIAGELSLKDIFEKALKSEKFNDSNESQIYKKIIEHTFGLNDKEIKCDSEIRKNLYKKYKDTELYKEFNNEGISKALDKLADVLVQENLIPEESEMNKYFSITNSPIDPLLVYYE